MSAVFSLASSPTLFAREEARFRDSLAPLALPGGLDAPAAHRVADRYAAVERPAPGHFENTPDSDPSVGSVREWGAGITARIASSTLGVSAVREARITSATTLESALRRVRAAGTTWGSWSGAARGAVLHAVGDALEANRAALVEVMASETGKTIDQADPEVSEAIDFAHFYGEPRGLARHRRRRRLHPGGPDPGDPAVELPRRDPRRVDARCPGCRFRGRPQARAAGRPQRCRPGIGHRDRPRRPRCTRRRPGVPRRRRVLARQGGSSRRRSSTG